MRDHALRKTIIIVSILFFFIAIPVIVLAIRLWFYVPASFTNDDGKIIWSKSDVTPFPTMSAKIAALIPTIAQSPSNWVIRQKTVYKFRLVNSVPLKYENGLIKGVGYFPLDTKRSAIPFTIMVKNNNVFVGTFRSGVFQENADNYETMTPQALIQHVPNPLLIQLEVNVSPYSNQMRATMEAEFADYEQGNWHTSPFAINAFAVDLTP